VLVIVDGDMVGPLKKPESALLASVVAGIVLTTLATPTYLSKKTLMDVLNAPMGATDHNLTIDAAPAQDCPYLGQP